MHSILGLSFDYHDAAAALIKDGVVVAAIQEERLSRWKHDSRLPKLSIAACLQKAGIKASQLDAVVYYEQPLLKFDRILKSGASVFNNGRSAYLKTISRWISLNKFDPQARIADLLKIKRSKVHYCDHHLSHAASAFYCSPFDKATIVTLDGVGEYETATFGIGSCDGIKKLSSTSFPQSIGLFYSAFTAYLGFEVNEGEYKVMGLAAFGQPTYVDKIRPLISVKSGKIVLDQSYFNFMRPDLMPFSSKLEKLLGERRIFERKLDFTTQSDGRIHIADPESARFANIASSVQKVTEEIVVEYVKTAVAATGIPQVAMSGGVALNCLANASIQRDLDLPLYVQPAAGDSGSALGAALYFHHKLCRESGQSFEKKPLTHISLGLAYSQEETIRALERYRFKDYEVHSTAEALVVRTAEILAENKIIGWVQDGFEWGPRSLGYRSILASPIEERMRDRVNMTIKYREQFRPFAPAVLAERTTEFFEVPRYDFEGRPEHFMLSVCPVKVAAKSQIAAVTHVDNTARVQMVTPTSNPRFYQLIKAFGEKTGVPVLLNTSFNLRGEPIVSSPEDAIKTFLRSEMDYLVIGNVVAHRPSPLRFYDIAQLERQ